MKFLAGSTLQKVLAALVAAIMSFSILTPAIKKPATNPKPTGIVHNVKKVDGKIVSNGPQIKEEQGIEVPDVAVPDDYDEDEDYTPQATEETPTAPAPTEEDVPEETPDAPAPEAQNEAPAEEPAPEEEAAPQAVAEWDVSATEEDDVHMYFFSEVAGAVRALFVPITAYAAEEPDGEDVEGDLPENVATVTNEGGVLHITGTGSTQGVLFLNLVKDPEKFFTDYEAWCVRKEIVSEDIYTLQTNITADAEFVNEEDEAFYGPAVAHAAVTHKDALDRAYVDYNELLEKYFPVYITEMIMSTEKFWDAYGKFTPTEIVIDEGAEIDTIGFLAFAYLPSVTSIKFEGTVRNIGYGAFAGLNITELKLPNGIVDIGADAFLACKNLTTVYLPASLGASDAFIGERAFVDMPGGSTIYCANANVVFKLREESGFVQSSVDDEDEIEVGCNYLDFRTSVEFWTGE